LPTKLPQYVTARALAPLDRLLGWSSPFLTRGAIGLFHKGQDVDSELLEATKSWKIGALKHPSITDSMGCILEVKDIARV
jgi:16S rRNA (guanine527-N7)-methyltransferase